MTRPFELAVVIGEIDPRTILIRFELRRMVGRSSVMTGERMLVEAFGLRRSHASTQLLLSTHENAARTTNGSCHCAREHLRPDFAELPYAFGLSAGLRCLDTK